MGTFYKFEIQGNGYLKNNCVGYYSMDFISARQSGKLTFLHTLKNNKSNVVEADLMKAKCEARFMIYPFMLAFSRMYAYKKDYYDVEGCRSRNVVVCRVPRSKTYFKKSQLYFQEAIKEEIMSANSKISNKLIDGVDYIRRIKDVSTTHLANSLLAQAALPELCSGDKPYPGITKNTCSISNEVRGRTILLIDDIYTLGVGVVEDCIQALYDKGARKVIFYAVGRTVKNRNTQSKEIDIDLEDFFTFDLDSKVFFKGKGIDDIEIRLSSDIFILKE